MKIFEIDFQKCRGILSLFEGYFSLSITQEMHFYLLKPCFNKLSIDKILNDCNFLSPPSVMELAHFFSNWK